MKKRKYIILGVVVILVIAIGVAGKTILSKTQTKLDGLVDMEIENIDLTQASDGVYDGAYSVFPVSVEVKVSIGNHTITGIELVRHVNGQGGPAEVLIGQVIERQATDMDVIAGATYSSKVILKSIGIALADAIK